MIKSNIIGLFSDVASDPLRKHFVISVPKILELMFPGVIDFFNKVQITGSHTEFYDKFDFRKSCIILFKFWFVFREFQEKFEDNFQTSTSFQKFIFYLVEDTLYFASQAFNELVEAIKIEHSLSSPEFLENNEEFMPFSYQARSWFQDLKISMELIDQMANFCPFVFEGSSTNLSAAENIGHLALTILNKLIKEREFTTVQFAKTEQLCNFHRTEVLLSIMYLLIKFKDCNNILIEIAKNAFYESSMFEEAVKEISLIPKEFKKEGVDSEFLEVNEKINQLKESLKEITLSDEIIDLFPDSLKDSITYELLTDPVKLPSGNIHQRSCILRLLSNDPFDPYTRMPLQIEQCVPDEQIKTVVEWYIARVRQGKDVSTDFDGKDPKFFDEKAGKLLEDPVLLPDGSYTSKANLDDPNAKVDQQMKVVVEWYANEVQNS